MRERFAVSHDNVSSRPHLCSHSQRCVAIIHRIVNICTVSKQQFDNVSLRILHNTGKTMVDEPVRQT